MKKIIDFVTKYPVAITALLCLVFFFLPFKPKPFGDGQFHAGTQQLIEYILHGFNGSISIDKGFLTLFCYLIPYSVVYSFHSDKLFFLSGVIFSCIFICLSVHYLFKAFDLLKFSRKAKFLTLVLLCLFPVHIYYAMGIIGEAFGFFAVSAFVYFWIKITNSKTNSLSDFMFLGLSLVLLYGIKPTMIPFIIAFTAFLVLRKFDFRNKLIYLAAVAIIPLLIAIESKLDNSDFEFKNTVFRNQILWSRFELRDEPFNWLPQHGHDGFESNDYLNNLKKRRELDSICEANHYDKTKYYINWVKDDITNNPGLTLRQYSLKFFQAQSFIISPLMKSNKSNVVKFGIHGYINLINYILIIVGLLAMVKLFRTRNYKLFVPFLFFWGWSLIYVFAFHSEQRYMFPARPILLFLFAYWVSNSKFINDFFTRNKNVNS
jgi:hypothetical protein